MIQKKILLRMQSNAFLLLVANLQFLNQIQMGLLLIRFLHHSGKKMKGFVVFVYLMLLFFQIVFMNKIIEYNVLLPQKQVYVFQ